MGQIIQKTSTAITKTEWCKPCLYCSPDGSTSTRHQIHSLQQGIPCTTNNMRRIKSNRSSEEESRRASYPDKSTAQQDVGGLSLSLKAMEHLLLVRTRLPQLPLSARTGRVSDRVSMLIVFMHLSKRPFSTPAPAPTTIMMDWGEFPIEAEEQLLERSKPAFHARWTPPICA